MKEEKLVRCRPCGYVMKESELGDVCPACGLPREVFEPYREKVSSGRLRFLALDIHPIAIHLSQTFVALVPFLIIFHYLFPGFEPTIVHSVIAFSVYIFPLTLILSAISGYADGLVRFKTINTPLLIKKIILSAIIIVLSIVQAIIFRGGDYPWYFLLLSLGALATAVQLGMLGKHLINVILPGTLVLRGAKKQTKTAEPVKKPKMSPEEIARLVQEKQAAKARAEKESEANE
ncbi:MAG: hypothetical protein BGO33_12405 [Bacteroidia bacterium 43-41]|nr:MAG: hypothetical protein BGO33_12405 [Bacteroidia bacterium 43-41]